MNIRLNILHTPFWRLFRHNDFVMSLLCFFVIIAIKGLPVVITQAGVLKFGNVNFKMLPLRSVLFSYSQINKNNKHYP